MSCTPKVDGAPTLMEPPIVTLHAQYPLVARDSVLPQMIYACHGIQADNSLRSVSSCPCLLSPLRGSVG